MTRQQRFQFYEKLYFQELERIEKVSGRLSLPFAVLVSIIAFLAFMLNSVSLSATGYWVILFWIFFCASSFALILGAWFFKMAWFGHSDKLLPTASAMEEHHKQLEIYHSSDMQKDALVKDAFDEFLFDYYTRFSSENAINNDQRSFNIYRSLVALTFSIFLAFAAALPFYLGNLQQKEILLK